MVGTRGLVRLVMTYGLEVFDDAVERIFDHGEKLVRSWFEQIPDGRYVSIGCVDDDGLDDRPIPFEVAVEIVGSSVRIDLSSSPPASRGLINTPLPTTVSCARVAIAML